MTRWSQAPELYFCSFCGKAKREVHRLIAGPGGVYVCDECVDRCGAHLAGRMSIPSEHHPLTLATAATAEQYQCSFCGRRQHMVRQLFLSPNAAHICDECVGICQGVVEAEVATAPQWSVSQPAVARLPARRHLLDVDDWTPDEFRALLAQAERMRLLAQRPERRLDTLRGRVLVNLCYENSTRTRVSFELAGKKLGADVTNVAAAASSVAKGESLLDTVRTLQALGATIFVVRSGQSGAPDLIARHID